MNFMIAEQYVVFSKIVLQSVCYNIVTLKTEKFVSVGTESAYW